MQEEDLAGVNKEFSLHVAAAATAATAETTLGRVPWGKARVVGAYFIPDVGNNMTGAATNNREIDVVDRGSGGAGTAEIATLAFTGSVNGSALIPVAMTLPATPIELNAGDVLTVQSNVNGTGLPLLSGQVVVQLETA